VEVLQIRNGRDYERALKREKTLSLLNFIGNTPLIQIHKLAKHLRAVKIFAKTEPIHSGVVVTIFPDGRDRYFSAGYCDEVQKGSRLNIIANAFTPLKD
jgi:hypothetical protein